MTQMVMAICGERYEQGFHIRRFAFLGGLMENDRVRDAKYINTLIDHLGIDKGDDDVYTSWTVGEEPPKEFVRFFDVYLYVENVGKPNAVYKADYHAYPHCPSLVIDDGMGIYRAIRKEGIRPSIKKQEKINKLNAVRRRQAALDDEMARRRAERFVRFEVGRMYNYPKQDSLGHLEEGIVKVTGIMKESKKVVVDIANGRKRVVVGVSDGEECESIYLFREGVVVSAKNVVKEEKE